MPNPATLLEGPIRDRRSSPETNNPTLFSEDTRHDGKHWPTEEDRLLSLGLALPTGLFSLTSPAIRRSPVCDHNQSQSDNPDSAESDSAYGDGQHKLKRDHDDTERQHVAGRQGIRVVPHGVVRKGGRDAEPVDTVPGNPSEHERHRQQDQDRTKRLHRCEYKPPFAVVPNVVPVPVSRRRSVERHRVPSGREVRFRKTLQSAAYEDCSRPYALLRAECLRVGAAAAYRNYEMAGRQTRGCFDDVR